MDGTSMGILGKLLPFDRAKEAVLDVLRVSEQQYIIKKTMYCGFVDYLMVSAKKSDGLAVFDVHLKKSPWCNHVLFFNQFLLLEGRVADESDEVSGSISISLYISSVNESQREIENGEDSSEEDGSPQETLFELYMNTTISIYDEKSSTLVEALQVALPKEDNSFIQHRWATVSRCTHNWRSSRNVIIVIIVIVIKQFV